jgi:hypothetical protein
MIFVGAGEARAPQNHCGSTNAFGGLLLILSGFFCRGLRPRPQKSLRISNAFRGLRGGWVSRLKSPRFGQSRRSRRVTLGCSRLGEGLARLESAAF